MHDRQALKTVLATLPVAVFAPFAAADVTDVQIEFNGVVMNQYEWDGTLDEFGDPVFVDTGINESFSASGGIDILPFEASGWGGVIGGFPIPEENISASGSVEPIAPNGTEFRMSGSSSIAEIFDLPLNAPFVTLQLSFTVTELTEYELFIHDFFFSNDTGGGGVTLYDSDNTVIAMTQPLFDEGTIGEGTLTPGTYRINASTFGNANFDFSMRIFAIPSPGAATLAIMAGAFAMRRRRD